MEKTSRTSSHAMRPTPSESVGTPLDAGGNSVLLHHPLRRASSSWAIGAVPQSPDPLMMVEPPTHPVVEHPPRRPEVQKLRHRPDSRSEQPSTDPNAPTTLLLKAILKGFSFGESFEQVNSLSSDKRECLKLLESSKGTPKAQHGTKNKS